MEPPKKSIDKSIVKFSVIIKWLFTNLKTHKESGCILTCSTMWEVKNFATLKSALHADKKHENSKK